MTEPRPCPFCQVKLAMIKHGDGSVRHYLHPSFSNCCLHGITVEDVPAWNRRSSPVREEDGGLPDLSRGSEVPSVIEVAALAIRDDFRARGYVTWPLPDVTSFDMARVALTKASQMAQSNDHARSAGDMAHSRGCPRPGNDDVACTCGLEWRIQLQTEREMHNAWRKRAEEAEAALSPSEPSGRGESGGIQGPPSEASMNKDVEDARRWRALMGSGRLHFMGCAGFKFSTKVLKEAEIDATAPHLHFGMEFWNDALPEADRASFPDDFERRFMFAYVDEMVRRTVGSSEPISADRDAVIEECARMCDGVSNLFSFKAREANYDDQARRFSYRSLGALKCADEIRSLKSPPTR